MSYRTLRRGCAAILLCLPVLAFGLGPKALVAQAKRAKSQKALEAALLALGCDSAFLDTVLGAKSPDFLLDPKRLRRGETFAANLDGDPEPETVSQLIFQGEPDEDSSYSKVYLIFVHDGKSGGERLLFRRAYPLTYCGKTRMGGMAFRFARAGERSEGEAAARKRILFNTIVVESCGLQISDYGQTDTLLYRDGALAFRPGSPRNESQIDHMNPP